MVARQFCPGSSLQAVFLPQVSKMQALLRTRNVRLRQRLRHILLQTKSRKRLGLHESSQQTKHVVDSALSMHLFRREAVSPCEEWEASRLFACTSVSLCFSFASLLSPAEIAQNQGKETMDHYKPLHVLRFEPYLKKKTRRQSAQKCSVGGVVMEIDLIWFLMSNGSYPCTERINK